MIRSILMSRVGLASLAAACAAVIVAAAIAAPAASAAAKTSHLACEFDGVAGNLNPAIPAVAFEQDGLYSFHGSATCTAVDPDHLIPPPAPFTVYIESNGYYSNLVVGTGDVAGVACISVNPNPAPIPPNTDPTGGEIGATPCPTAPTPLPTQANLVDYFHFPGGTTGNSRVGYGIDFGASGGNLGGGAYGPAVEPATPPPLGSGLPNTGPDAYNVTGGVNILADQVPPVSSFTVHGAFDAYTP